MLLKSCCLYRSQQIIVLTPVEIGGQRLRDDKDSCTRVLSSNRKFVNQSEFKIQLLAAVPGSGSKWSFKSIALLTGRNSLIMVDISLRFFSVMSLSES